MATPQGLFAVWLPWVTFIIPNPPALEVSHAGLCLQLWTPVSAPPASFHLMTAAACTGRWMAAVIQAGV